MVGQFFESMDRGVTARGASEPELRVDLLVSAIERAASSYPAAIDHNFSIIDGSRKGEFMNSAFALMKVEFKRGQSTRRTAYNMQPASALVDVIGSGARSFRDTHIRWQAGDAGGTSRAVYSAFAESLRVGGHPRSGGPPQLVGLIRKGPAKSFGVIWNGGRYFGGMEIVNSSAETPVRWHNELFELCNPATLTRIGGAQSQPSPRGSREDMDAVRRQPRPLP